MTEIEAKFPVLEFKDIIKKIEELGFVKKHESLENVVYYDSPDGRWKQDGVTIRTKELDGKVVFTVKRKIKGDFKSAMEKECEVFCQSGHFNEILEIINLIPDLQYSKSRIHYERNDGCSIELDNVEEINAKFVELEVQSEDEMRALIEELGFKEENADMRSYPNIIREARKNG